MMLRQATARDHPGGKAYDAGTIREPEDLQEEKGEQEPMAKGSAERRSSFFITIIHQQKGDIMKTSKKQKKKVNNKGKKEWKKPTLEDVSGRVMAQPYIRFT